VIAFLLKNFGKDQINSRKVRVKRKVNTFKNKKSSVTESLKSKYRSLKKEDIKPH
jgi:hypothetical protein